MQIRLAAPADFPQLTRIWRAAVEATHDFVTAEQIDAWEPQVREAYLPALTVWAALNEGESTHPAKILGFAGVEPSADPAQPAMLQMLFVDPQRHGSGVGRALVEAASTKFGPLLVDVNEQNPGAVSFYFTLGFEQIGRSERDTDGNPYPILHLARTA